MPKKMAELVSARLNDVNALLNHPLLQADNSNHPYRNIIRSIRMELRLLQAGLTDDNPAHKKMLANWCAVKSTTNRLNTFAEILDGLAPVTAVVEHPQSLELRNRWGDLSRKTDDFELQNSHVDELIMDYFVKQPYNAKQIKLFGLDSLDTINPEGKKGSKSLKLVKEGGYHTVYVVSELAVPVGTIIKEGLNASSSPAQSWAQAASALSSIAPYVPIIGASLTAASTLYDFTKSMVSRTGYSDRAQRAIMVGLSITALALTAVFPGAALAFTAAMIAAGAYMSYVKPYLELRTQEKSLVNALEGLQEREEHIANNKHDLVLTEVEKSALLSELTIHYSRNTELSLEDMSYARELIKSGDVAAVSNNYTLKNALGNRSVRDVMVGQCKQEQTDLSHNIEQVKVQKKRMGLQSINAIFTVLGASMIAVPIPPVMVAGIVILTVSTVVGLAIRYQDPIKKLFSRITGLFAKSADSADENKPSPGMGPSLTAEAEVPMPSLDMASAIVSESSVREQATARAQMPTVEAAKQNRDVAKPLSIQQQDPKTISKMLSEEAIAASRSLKAALPRHPEKVEQRDEEQSLGHSTPRIK